MKTSPKDITVFNQPVPELIKGAVWIWPEHYSWDNYNSFGLFRKAFVLKTLPRKAPLYITADQSYNLYINGAFVARGPARGFQSHWPYDEIDVAAHLRKGRNIIAVRAHNPSFSNYQYLTQGNAGFLMAADFGAVKLLTDGSWKATKDHGVSQNTVPSSLQLFSQEQVDARVSPQGWTQIDFDDSKWGGPCVAGRWNSMPWNTLEPRGTPMLVEKKIHNFKLLGTNAGACADGFKHTRCVVLTRSGEDLTHTPVKNPLPAAANGHALEIPPTGANKFRSYLLDFGHTVVGSLCLRVTGGKGGEIVDTLHVETIDAKKLQPDLVPWSWCRMRFGSRLVCRKGESAYDFHHPYGFRYLVVTVRDTSAKLNIDVSLNWIGYPLHRNGGFHSSDALLEKIWETCEWTQQCCSLDAYVDTPWREQAQWWGDARVQGWNTFHVNGDARLFRRGIHCIASQTTPNGLTYGHAPTMAHNCILPDFTLIWMITIWDYYWQTGSTEPLAAYEKTIDAALDYFREMTDPKLGLVKYDNRYWLFLDWTGIFKEGYPTVLNAWLVIALEKLAELYTAAGNPAKSRTLMTWAKSVRAGLKKLVDKKGLLRDGFSYDRKPVAGTCVHSQTLALMANLNPGHERVMLDKVLVPFITEKHKPEVYPSAYWITYVFSTLIDQGYANDVVAFIRKHWEPMTEHGTTFENFAPTKGQESFSHAWSAHPLFHLMRTIGGITQTAPAWKAIRFKPDFIGNNGGATIPTAFGPIISKWTRNGPVANVSLKLPLGVKATVQFPHAKDQVVTGVQSWIVRLVR